MISFSFGKSWSMRFIGQMSKLSNVILSVLELVVIASILEEDPVKLDCCPTFDVVVHLHTAFAIKPQCPANCPQSVLAVLPPALEAAACV